jgi:hypothetical protein
LKLIFLFVITTALFHSTCQAEKLQSAKISSAVLDSHTMNLFLEIDITNPCSTLASPEVIQDPKQPGFLQVNASVRKSPGACIEQMSNKVEVQTISLPEILSGPEYNISLNEIYVIRFEGLNSELVVSGRQLRKSVQPQPISL